MMLAWAFSVRSVDEVSRLVRALGRHRYVREVDHRIHWTVDHALADVPAFAARAAAFAARRRTEHELEIASRDPSLWRAVTADEVVTVLDAFWSPSQGQQLYRRRLVEALAETGLAPATHAPFHAPPDEPPHPELIQLDWVLLPVDE